MKKLYFVVQHFRGGGAERVASVLINELSSRGYDIIVEADFSKGQTYLLPDNVTKIQTFLKQPGKNAVQVMVYFIQRLINRRKKIKKYSPDVVISFLPRTFFETKLSCCGLHKKHIVSDHTSMDRKIGRLDDYIRHNFYNKADYSTILTQKDASLVKGKLKNSVVVYNPLTFKPIDAEHIGERENIILCVGRVNQWDIKGYDRICEIWREISPQYPVWKLCFVGEASDATKSRLIAISGKKNAERIIFYGQQSDVKTFYRRAAIFALPSRVEGFPMALAEAMSQGCACVAFSIKGAIDEIINDGQDGYIIADGNLSDFRNKLGLLMSDGVIRKTLAENAVANIKRFDSVNYADRWVELIEH